MNRYIRLFSFLVLLCAVFTAAANTSVSGFTDRIIVKMKSSGSFGSQFSVKNVSLSLSSNQVKTLASSIGLPLKYSHQLASTKAHVMGLGRSQSIEQVKQLAQKMMANDDNIEYAEPDYLMFPSSVVPTDPGFVDQWHLHDASSQGLNVSGAWQHTTGSSDVVVAVVDTGILAGHPDFDPARILPGYDFISQDDTGTYVAANDGDGRDADPSDPGDWVTEAESQDESSSMYECPVGVSDWHGTHVAGTIAASSNNGVGITGIDWSAKMLPVRVLGKCGGYTSDISDGVIWAAGGVVSGVPVNEYPANVINLSLGTEGVCSFTMQAAINMAFNRGVTIIVAAGNESSPTEFMVPANCENVVVVGAHDNQGHLSDFSNYGREVDLLAPGGSTVATNCSNSIISLSNTGQQTPVNHYYGCSIGTSMAAPHVSGLVALMLSRNAYLSPDQIERLLKASAREYSQDTNCSGDRCGSGLADAEAAILASGIPYAPSGLIAQQDNGSVQLTWQDHSALESGFKIEYANNNGGFETVLTTQANATSYEHVHVKDGLAHYRLGAVNGEFASEVITVGDVDVPFKTISVLNVSASSSSIHLTWQDNSNYESGVEIYRVITGGTYELLTTAPKNSVDYVDTDVVHGELYRYKLRAIKSDAQGGFIESDETALKQEKGSTLGIIYVALLLFLSFYRRRAY